MIYFCADDYGMTNETCNRIENCIKNGALNKVSVLPNGEIKNFKERLCESGAEIALHINLVEGFPLSNPDEVWLLTDKNKTFRYSFIGLLLLSIGAKRKEAEKQIYTEIKNQISFWRENVGFDRKILIDSHQHTHMIPLIFKTLMKVIKEEGVEVEYLRIPREPVRLYLSEPSLYFTYRPVNIIKQWLLNFFTFLNKQEIKKSGIDCAYFMGVLFSGKMDENRVRKLIGKYIKLAEKNNKNIELAFHPGYMQEGEQLPEEIRKGFEKFYYSPWRVTEYNALKGLKEYKTYMKEGKINALH